MLHHLHSGNFKLRAQQRQVLPLRIAVGNELLKNWESDFSVIERITQIPAFENPCGRDPAHRQTGKLLDVISSARPGISQQGNIWLLSKIVLCEGGAPVLAAVPDGD